MSFPAQLRSAIAARLTASGVAGGNVRLSTMIPMEPKDLPCANVYILAGRGDCNAANANEFDAELTVAIEVFCKDSSDAAAATAIDDLVAAALAAVMTDASLRRTIRWKHYDWETDLDASSAHRLAAAQIKLTGSYLNEYEFEFENDLESIGMDITYGGHVVTHTEIPIEEG